jgi:hypothetical protein
MRSARDITEPLAIRRISDPSGRMDPGPSWFRSAACNGRNVIARLSAYVTGWYAVPVMRFRLRGIVALRFECKCIDFGQEANVSDDATRQLVLREWRIWRLKRFDPGELLTIQAAYFFCEDIGHRKLPQLDARFIRQHRDQIVSWLRDAGAIGS